MGEIIPTERELEILKILWQQGGLTVREVWRQLSTADKEVAYTTILSLLQTMEKKGLVAHQPQAKAYVYSAKVGRSDTMGELAGRFLQRVFDGAMDEYLVHGMRARRLSLEELDRLEAMIAEAKKNRSPRPDPKRDES